MDYYWKTIAMIITGVVLWVVLEKQEKHISVLLTTGICCIAAIASAVYLKPVIQFVHDLNQMDDGLLQNMIRLAGIGFLSEITGRICSDAGNTSAASMARFLGSSAILYGSIPLFQTLMDLIQDLMGTL